MSKSSLILSKGADYRKKIREYEIDSQYINDSTVNEYTGCAR